MCGRRLAKQDPKGAELDAMRNPDNSLWNCRDEAREGPKPLPHEFSRACIEIHHAPQDKSSDINAVIMNFLLLLRNANHNI